ncbi:unnamed protein product, partial [Hymenolepis diminuta]
MITDVDLESFKNLVQTKIVVDCFEKDCGVCEWLFHFCHSVSCRSAYWSVVNALRTPEEVEALKSLLTSSLSIISNGLYSCSNESDLEREFEWLSDLCLIPCRYQYGTSRHSCYPASGYSVEFSGLENESNVFNLFCLSAFNFHLWKQYVPKYLRLKTIILILLT